MSKQLLNQVEIAKLASARQGNLWNKRQLKLYDRKRDRNTGPGEESLCDKMNWVVSGKRDCDFPEVRGEAKSIYVLNKTKNGKTSEALTAMRFGDEANSSWGMMLIEMPEALKKSVPRHLLEQVGCCKYGPTLKKQLPKALITWIEARMKTSVVLQKIKNMYLMMPMGYIHVPEEDFDDAIEFYQMAPGKPKYRVKMTYLRRLAGIDKAM